MRYKKILSLYICALSMFLHGCSEPGETTGMGAATGGVIGAGLGAVVGNQTGDAGSGFLVGAVAGSAAGAAMGNALEAQQEVARTQDEALERQEQRLMAQRAELDELRRLSDDNVSFSGQRNISNERSSHRDEVIHSPSRIKETTLEEDAEAGKGAYRWESPAPAKEAALENVVVEKKAPALLSDECLRAEEEAHRASSLPDVADKLFHYRRALRLCPDSPNYHSELGRIYVSLGRTQDAEFEYREALRLDPDSASVQAELQTLKR